MPNDTTAKRKLTDEERVARAQRRAEQANARLLDTKRKIEGHAQKLHARACFLLGGWLDAKLRDDPALRKQVKLTLLVSQPSDEECLETYWKSLGEATHALAVVETSGAPVKSAAPVGRTTSAASAPGRAANEQSAAGETSSAASAAR